MKYTYKEYNAIFLILLMSLPLIYKLCMKLLGLLGLIIQRSWLATNAIDTESSKQSQSSILGLQLNWLEHLLCKQEVVGSFPISSTSEFTYMNAIPIDFARECRVYFGLFVYRQDATLSRWQAEFDSLIDRIIIFFVSLQIINNDYLRRKMYLVCEYRVHFYPRLAQLDQSESFLNSRLQVRFLYRGHFVLQA